MISVATSVGVVKGYTILVCFRSPYFKHSLQQRIDDRLWCVQRLVHPHFPSDSETELIDNYVSEDRQKDLIIKDTNNHTIKKTFTIL